MDITLNTLSNWYKEYSTDPNGSTGKYIEVGFINPSLNYKLVDYILTKWVEEHDKRIDIIEQTTNDPYELSLALASRGFTLAEYRRSIKGIINEEDYQDSRFLEYFYIVDKSGLNRFRSDQMKYEEESLTDRYLKAISKAIKEEIPLLSEFFFNNKIKKKLPLDSFLAHVYIIAGTNSGKSEILKNLLIISIKNESLTWMSISERQHSCS